MVSCKNCNSPNSLDGAFCKKCGATLPDDDIQIAKEKVEAAVAEGYKLLSNGRTDEAMRVSEDALLANPASTRALSLKAMCHERVGQISEALACHERVLELDPDSILDRIKANDLRNLLVARASIAAQPDRRMAIAGAVAAFVLVASICLLFAKNAGEAGADQKVAANLPAQSRAQGFDLSSQAKSGVTPKAPPDSPERKTPPADANASGNETPDSGNRVTLPNYTRPDAGPTLPGASGGVAVLQGPVGPVRIDPDDVAKIRNSQPQAPPAGNSTRTDPPPTEMPPPTKPESHESPGIMEIKILGKGDQTGPNPGIGQNGAQALMHTARNEYQLGHYQNAATRYEQALRAGADTASGNQRLAQCYEKLGRSGDALAAYQRAIAALQGDLDSGSGDKARISAALDSCKQAVKVLGG